MKAIDDLVDKYMEILSIRGAKPVVEVKTRVGSGWLGRDSWVSTLPYTTTLELQRSILGDPRTLERIVAHEMVHHRDFLAMTPDQIALSRFGIRGEDHGAAFRHGAAIINAVMGPDFVTVHSDKEYVQAPLDKDLYLLIVPIHGGRLGYAWAARLSPEATSVVAKNALEGGKLVRTRDRQWTEGRAKIKRFGGLSVPKVGTPMEAQLRALYESG
jgi:hypothetical protein